MAGVTKDEGSPVASILLSDNSFNNFTKEGFKEIVLRFNEVFHNINVESVVNYYLNNTDLKDPNAIQWRINEFFGDLAIKCPTYFFAKQYAEHSSPETGVYFYSLTHTARGSIAEHYMRVFFMGRT